MEHCNQSSAIVARRGLQIVGRRIARCPSISLKSPPFRKKNLLKVLRNDFLLLTLHSDVRYATVSLLRRHSLHLSCVALPRETGEWRSGGGKRLLTMLRTLQSSYGRKCLLMHYHDLSVMTKKAFRTSIRYNEIGKISNNRREEEYGLLICV